MSDYRTPEGASAEQPIPEEDLVPVDDTIIGQAFLWSLVVFAALTAAVGGMIWMLKEPSEVALPGPAIITPPRERSGPRVPPPLLPFTDITLPAGIDFIRENGATGEKLLPETMGGGCAFTDYDNDGDQDLLLINSTHWPDAPDKNTPLPPASAHALYRNDGSGRFTDVTLESGLDVSFYGMGVAIGDYDNDGDPDVFMTAVGRNYLFENTGGYFRDITHSSGVAGGNDKWSTSAGFFDYDGDGDLDLFVCNYVKWSRHIDFAVDYRLTGIGRAYGPPTNFEGTTSYLYRNNGDGTFTDVSAKAGIEINNPATGKPLGKALGLCFLDADDDGWIDVCVANDTVQNFFFRNRGDGTFEEVGGMIGVAFDRDGHATGAMGIDSAFYRNDQALGIGIGNFANEMTSLYVSHGSPMQFTDEAIPEEIGAPTRLFLTFGLFFFDADLDGRLDLLQCNGHLEEQINVVQPSQQYEQPTQLFWNAKPHQDATFVDVPRSLLGDLSQPIVGRGAAYADIDGDGDLDVLLTQPKGRPLLLRNDQHQGNHWLRVKLIGRRCNRDAIGAWIDIETQSGTQRQQVMPTRSYLSQVELPVTFGLGNGNSVESIRIEWPDGSTQEVRDVSINQLLVIEQERAAD